MTKPPELVALDITDVIHACLARPGMHKYYVYYPLQEMIQDLLSSIPSPGETEVFYENISNIVPWEDPSSDMEVHLFVERFYMDMDNLVINTLGKIYDVYVYSMVKWISPNSIILNLIAYEDSSAYNNKQAATGAF